ncbi:MAG: glycoside hydrolase family 30 beta sandwich domain-containing protein [Myxococcales bacterium]
MTQSTNAARFDRVKFMGKSQRWVALLAASGMSFMFGCGGGSGSASSTESSGGSNSSGAGAGGSPAGLGGAPTSGGFGTTGGQPSSSGGGAAGALQSSGGGAAGGSEAGGSPAMSGGGAGGGSAGSSGGAAGLGGAGQAGSAGKTPGTAAANAATVDPSKEYQTMDGFGFADVWQAKGNSTPTLLTLLFDPVNGIGASLLRIGIDGTSGKPNIMGDAAFVDGPAVVKYGGKVWAAPWSPPASDKDNNNVNNGGHLLPADYDSWASVLAAFPAYYKQQSGVDLYAISAQNEPDFVASYQSCIFNSAQMNAWIKVLQPKLAALKPPVAVLAAEPDAYSNLWGGDNYGNAILNDATVSPLVTIIATHDYDNASSKSTTRPAPPAGANSTHHLWETEATYNSTGAGITPGLDIARGIYAAVTGGGVNGWLYWWTQSLMDGGTASNPPKRVYGLGNFSKFVRPGYVRIGVTGQPSSLQVATFKNPSDNTVVIVVLNSGTSAVTLPVFVSGASWPATVTPYVTDSAHNLAAQSPITVTAANFSASVAAQSITTFVGKP